MKSSDPALECGGKRSATLRLGHSWSAVRFQIATRRDAALGHRTPSGLALLVVGALPERSCVQKIRCAFG